MQRFNTGWRSCHGVQQRTGVANARERRDQAADIPYGSMMDASHLDTLVSVAEYVVILTVGMTVWRSFYRVFMSARWPSAQGKVISIHMDIVQTVPEVFYKPCL